MMDAIPLRPEIMFLAEIVFVLLMMNPLQDTCIIPRDELLIHFFIPLRIFFSRNLRLILMLPSQTRETKKMYLQKNPR
jgi:hypothetical protein